MAAIEVKVRLRGPLFEKKIDKVVEEAIVFYAMRRIETRVRRVPKRKKGTLGRRRNPIPKGKLDRTPPMFGLGTLELGGGVAMTFKSTLKPPRTKGKSWQRKNVAIIKSMAPRVMRSVAKQIAANLS